ncbi:tetratricopeptide repeat protein, partial [bacterium]
MNSLGWHLLETKEFDKAIAYLNRGKELEPNNTSLAINLAHSYLFHNEYDKAIQLYLENLDK